MKKKTTNKPAPQAKDAHYWQISIALSAINVLIMLYMPPLPAAQSNIRRRTLRAMRLPPLRTYTPKQQNLPPVAIIQSEP